MPEPAARSERSLRDHWPAAVLALLAACVAIWAKHHLFPALSWNRDEPVYLWHMEVLRQGHLTAPDGGHPELFLPWLSAARDGVMFTQYTPGWPLVLLVARLVTGSATTALYLGAALAVVGTYAITIELFHDRRRATLAAALLVASPILPIQGGVHLSYLFTLGLGLIFGALLLSGHRRRRPLRLLAAGLVLGWIFLTRPYDAVLWGAAFAVHLLVTERHRWRPAVRGMLVCGAAALPFVATGLLYNQRITGSWLEFPITLADPLDTFGFGVRRLMPGFEKVDYDLATALRATAKNAFFLPWFLAGSYVALLTAALGLWFGRRERGTLALLLVSAVFPVGYFVFWGNHLSSEAVRISGPIYFIPLYATICILVAAVVGRWWDRRPRLAWALIVLLAIGTVPVMWSRLDVNRDVSVEQAAWRQSTEALDEPSLVLVADTGNHLLYTNPFSSNSRDLDDPVLFAALSGPTVLDLIAAEPGRDVYVQVPSVASQDIGPREEPHPLAVELVPADVRRGERFVLELTVRPSAGAAHVALHISTGAAEQKVTIPVTKGTATHEVELAATGPGGALALADHGRIRVDVGWGASPVAAAAQPLVRHDLMYRVVDGVVEVLLPPLSYRNQEVGDERQWRFVPELDELKIDVTRVAAGR